MMDNRSGRLRMAGAGVLIATFLVGGLGGVAIERVLLNREAAKLDTASSSASSSSRGIDRGGDRDRRGSNDRSGDWQADFWRRSDYGKLGLDSTQIQRVNSVLVRQREQMDAYWKETQPRYDAIVELTRTDLRAILTAAQRTELDRIRQERRERWQRERARADSTGQRSSADQAAQDGKGCP